MTENISTESWESKGKYLTKELTALFDDENQWKFYKKTSKTETSFIHKDGNQYRVNGWFPSSPKNLIKVFFNQFEDTPKWYRSAGTYIIVEQLLERTHIGYQKSLQFGPISPRDFMLLRHYEQLSNEGFILAFKSIDWNEDKIGNPTNAVRGDHGLSGWRFRPIPGKENESIAELICSVNLNMAWIPFLEVFAIRGFQELFTDLRKYLDTKK